MLGPPGSVGHGIQYDGFDLGIYGLSFLERQKSKPTLQVGLTVDGLTFVIQGRVISVDGRIQYMKKLKSKAQRPMKVGMEFTRIDPSDVFFIAQIIASKSTFGWPTYIEIDDSGERGT